ncbi:MAG TPA: HAD family hydrolase [Bacillota bacterium]|nr:HAD family hydrolase [Bacillota bacterium]
MKYEHILIDLDGTITDSFPGIAASFAYALEKFGIHVSDVSQLRRCVGPPIIESFMTFYGMDEAHANDAVAKYREYYTDRGIFENSVYAGVPEMLRELHESGLKTYLATSKPRPFAERIISHFGLDGYFTFISGSEFDGTRSEKYQVIAYLLTRFAIPHENALMVGDRMHDVDGANQCMIDCASVLYGYGTRNELLEHGAKYICETPADLTRLITNK